MSEPTSVRVEWGPKVMDFPPEADAIEFARELGAQSVSYRRVWTKHLTPAE